MTRVLRRADIVDILVRDGESLALTDGRCLRLSEIATAVVVYLDRPRDAADLEAHLTEQFGVAPEGVLGQIIIDLTRAGLITEDG